MSMWNYKTVDRQKTASPVTIVEDACKELYQISDGTLIARIRQYEGEYRSSPAVTLSKTRESSFFERQTFDVQSVMGDNASDEEDEYENRMVYELYLTSIKTPKYKYRVLFLYFGIRLYPVELTIQEDIAKEIGCASEGTACADEASFREMLGRILSCEIVGSVLSSLAALNHSPNNSHRTYQYQTNYHQ